MAKVKTQIGDCTVEECAKPKYAHNLCRKHNQRRYKTGRTDLGPRVPWNKSGIEICMMDTCNNKHLAKGLCSTHYAAFRSFMDKDRTLENQAKIGPQKEKEYIKLYRPSHPFASKQGFVKEHRLVMEEMIGRYLERHETVHHKNGNRQDNRPENLELWSRRQPSGQRAEDKVTYAIEILKLYAPDLLKGGN
jgi:hypothetical protein